MLCSTLFIFCKTTLVYILYKYIATFCYEINVQRYISIVVLILNTSSILNSSLCNGKNKALSVMVIAINVTDIFYSIYLCIIWIADLSFQKKIHVKEELWRSSVACFCAFFIMLYFTLLSTFVLTFMALSRLMLVWYPVDTKYKDHNFVFKSILSLSSLSFIICLSVTIIFRIHFGILPMSLCLPFVDPSNSIVLIKIIVWSSILIQSLLSMVIVIIYILLALGLYKVKNEDINLKSIHTSYGSLILQLILITVSNMVCWFSTNGIYIATLILTEYSTEVVIWSIVILMPINSIVYPTVFVIMSIKYVLRSRSQCTRNKYSKLTVPIIPSSNVE